MTIHMQVDDRPFFNCSNEELETLAHQHWDNYSGLVFVLYEAQFREKVANERKAEIVARLVELAGMRLTPVLSPGFEFPDTDIVEARRIARASDIQFQRSVGLLNVSGYKVGRNGERPTVRRRILNFIFLKDTLNDVDDREYANQWGAPRTAQRLKKLADSIATFARNAKRNNRHAMRYAIEDWQLDLAYLKETFYRKWHEFPWPDVEV